MAIKNTESNILVFNKKNAKAFADMIFSESKGVVRYLKLCDGTLQNGKVGGRTTHCVVGEAYHTFVNSSLKKITGLGNTDGSIEAINQLVKIANLKDKSEKSELDQALALCISSNDGIIADDDESAYLFRAQKVAKTWLEKVVPLLK